jgi:hypothetical protein
MALFGAIIAVGLGPALWLGAQFGHIAVDPAVPKAPITADSTRDNAPGRAGAAVDEAGLDTRLNVVPDKPVNPGVGRQLVPLSNTPSARPSGSPSAIEQPQRTPSVAPSTPAPTTPTRSSAPPSPPPPESTTPPATEPPASSEPTEPAEPTDEPSTPADIPTTDAGTPTDVATEPVPPVTQNRQV